MSMCLFLILPKYWTKVDYVASKKNQTELLYDCKCTVVNGTIQPRGRRIDDQMDTAVFENKIKEFSYLVSLSMPAYIDELWERRFACSGAIVAKNWVLTGSVCIIENSEHEYLTVRELSDYWSKGGILHKVISASIKSKTQPLAVKIENSFSIGSDFSTSIPIKTIQSLMSVGWREPNIIRKKFESFLVDVFSEKKCWICIAGVITEKRNCDYESSGKPLIVNCNYLYGMQCKTRMEDSLQFLHLPTNRTGNWWLSLEDSPSTSKETAEVKNIYGVPDTNVEQCKKLDLKSIIEDQATTTLST